MSLSACNQSQENKNQISLHVTIHRIFVILFHLSELRYSPYLGGHGLEPVEEALLGGLREVDVLLLAVVEGAALGRGQFAVGAARRPLHQLHVLVLETLRLAPEVNHQTAQQGSHGHCASDYRLNIKNTISNILQRKR